MKILIHKAAERMRSEYHPLPNTIKKPSRNHMEPVYEYKTHLYAVMPFMLPPEEESWRTMIGLSALYYAIAEYDKHTGRFLKHYCADNDKATVQKAFDKLIPQMTLMKNPYHLYDLRVSHGYLY